MKEQTIKNNQKLIYDIYIILCKQDKIINKLLKGNKLKYYNLSYFDCGFYIKIYITSWYFIILGVKAYIIYKFEHENWSITFLDKS